MKATLDVLKVFITQSCRGCKRALELAAWVRKIKPKLVVEVVDLSLPSNADHVRVFAVPAYVYGDRTVFLGNPSHEELGAWLARLEA
ncbi:MAG: thioredoxin family protein [Chloroflexi bacterium]|nr:thioredoxin family protein [Chloroflexota bacterium]